MTAGQIIILIVSLVVAIVVNVLIMRWLRKSWERRVAGNGQAGHGVRVFGAPSAVLTWLKYRVFPSIKLALQFVPDLARSLNWRRALVEIAVIAVVAIFYARPILDFDSRRSMPGNEYQAHAGSVIPFVQWLREGQEFPLWNPVVEYGRSWIGDPFLFVFNPFLSLPMVFWGVVNGTKVAVFLNLLLAGLGRWVLGRLLKFDTPARLWASLLYMLSGSLVSHLPVGQEQLAFALDWLPWSLAGFMWALRTRSWASVAGASAAQALFFFTGNFYYQMYGFTCLLVIAVAYMMEWMPVRLNREAIRQTALVGIVSLGLVAIQFLPQLASRSSIRNAGGFVPEDEEFYGSQTPANALVNYIVSDKEFINSPILDKAPYIQESYRYIGLIPFVLLFWLIPAAQRGNRREIIAFAICFLLMLAWASIRYSFFKEIYRAIPILFQFRWPGRAMNVGVLYLILLSGYGLDELWRRLRSIQGRLVLNDESELPIFAFHGRTVLLALVVVGVGWSVQDVYTAHHDLFYLDALASPEVDTGLAWLRAQDSTEYAMHTTSAITNLHTFDAYGSRMRFVDISDGWGAAPTNVVLGRPEAVTVQPKYWLIWEVETVDDPQAELLKQFGTLQIWRAPGFPYAFLIPVNRLTREPFVVDSQEVASATSARRDGPNRIVIKATVDETSVLVISESWFIDWKVWVDGRIAPLESVSSLLAVQLTPGRHEVVFQYDPLAFKIGSGLSGLTLLLIIGLVLRERRRKMVLAAD